ncbi:hypothetical protein KXW64_008672, partial [Aspergillus fumigatus]
CIGSSYPDLYMTVYRDSSRSTPTVTSLYTVNSNIAFGTPSATVITAINNAQNQYPTGTIVMVNGWVYDPANVPTLNNGDVVEIVSDPDI